MLQKLLAEIQSGGTREPGDLADRLGTTPQMVMVMLEHLERMGWLHDYAAGPPGCADDGGCSPQGCADCALGGACSPAAARGRVWKFAARPAAGRA